MEPGDAERLEEAVVRELLGKSVDSDTRFKAGTLKLVAEYLRLVVREAIERSIEAASRDPDALGAVEERVVVEPAHVARIAQGILLDL